MALPTKPERNYFLFGRPFELRKEDAKDREKCDKIYKELKIDLETNISYLLEQRQNDPYKEFEKRIVYETLNRKRAPTFNPIPLP